MIIVEKSNKICDLLNAINCEVGRVKLDLCAFEVSSIQHDELYLVEKEVLTQVSDEISIKFQSCTAIIIYGEVCEDLSQKFSNIISFINDQTSNSLILNQLYHLNDLISEKEVLKSRLVGLNRELSLAMGTLESELFKVKTLYDQKVPRRIDNVKGMQFFSKYSAGESNGGEFFDQYRKANHVFIMMSSTSSYLASSTTLGLFSTLKAGRNISLDLQKQFIIDLASEVQQINQNKKKNIRMNLFSAVIDLSTFEVNGYIFGDFKILSSTVSNTYNGNNEDISVDKMNSTAFKKTLGRGERILLASPGLIQNWEHINPGFMIEELLVRREVRPVDILDEVFFQIKKESESGMLSSDASAILVEVDKNVMLKV